MIRIPRLKLAGLAIALAACSAAATAADPAPDAAAPAAAAPAADAEPVSNCISLSAIRNTKVLDGRTILFEMTGNRTLVNRLPRNCPGLNFEKRFLYKTSLNQLCSQDIITVLTGTGSGAGRGASCGLGKFETYVPPEAVGAKPDKGTLEPAD